MIDVFFQQFDLSRLGRLSPSLDEALLRPDLSTIRLQRR